MKVTLARNNGNNVVEHWVFNDPYRAQNFYNAYCGQTASIIKCESVYTIGSGEHADPNCIYCPLNHICVCENYSLTTAEEEHFETKVIDTTKFK